MRRDEAWLLDILIAPRDATEFLEGVTWAGFSANRMLQLATTRCLEIIGEAAAKVSVETRHAHPSIPWQSMIGIRNRLVHEYFQVDLQVVWDTVRNDLPGLLDLIEPLVPPEEGI
jgi:uncharacterized protein with HEPN domain